MTRVDQERRLRRAIAELARCRIEDIESIWAMLPGADRERLRPLLADASSAVAGAPISPAIAPDTEAGSGADRLARAFAALPVELAARLAAGLDDAERTRALARLPDERRRALAGCIETRTTGFRISPRAGDALRDAVLAIDPPADAALPASPAAPRTLRDRFRSLVGKRR
ncbi:hypothetical protein [Burkholderia sp. SIMBA_062]|uniref:hypothetical protein n=2 Tax=Pseudomonadota TaxID=1224 RepID=UPI00397865B4